VSPTCRSRLKCLICAPGRSVRRRPRSAAVRHGAIALCFLVSGAQGCVTPAWPEGYKPPAREQKAVLYELTQKTVRAARKSFPLFLVRVESEASEVSGVLWAEIPARFVKRQGLEHLPFLPIPQLQIPVGQALENCSKVEVFANPTAEKARAIEPDQDVILTPLVHGRPAPVTSECSVVVYYGTLPGRDGVWLQIATAQGILSEHLVARSRPGYWALVPLAAIGETAMYAGVTAVFLLIWVLSHGAVGSPIGVSPST
jgi:hypothetical protein